MVRILGTDDLDEAQGLCAKGRFCWLDLEDPDDATVARVGEALDLNALAIEDTQEFGQRPKVDAGAEQMLMVYFAARSGEGGSVALTEVHIHVSRRFVLTVHREPCAILDRLQTTIQQGGCDSEQELIYRLLDTLTDSLLDVLDGVAAGVAEQDSDLYRKPRASERDRMAMIRRSLDASRRIIQTQRQVFERMVQRVDELPFLSRELNANYGDISDHLWRAVDDMETARETLQGMIDGYSNAVQERLTVVATIFLPLTVVTGFFGQNFNWMINHIGSFWTFWGLGVGGLIFSALLIRFWLIRSGMYDRPGKS